MKNSTCPKCNKDEMLIGLKLRGGNENPPFVMLVEPQPKKLPFLWVPKIVQSEFSADICGACGYTEFHASTIRSCMKPETRGIRKRNV